jgi:hypothetical protein
MNFCEMLFSKILKADHSLFDDIHWRDEMICMIIAAKSVLANRGIVLRIIEWSIDGKLQLDEGCENT